MARRVYVIPPHGHLQWLLVCFLFGAVSTPLIAWAAFPWWLLDLRWPLQALLLFGPGVLFIALTHRRCQHVAWHLVAVLAVTAGQWGGGLAFVRACAGPLGLDIIEAVAQAAMFASVIGVPILLVVGIDRWFFRRIIVGPTDRCPECGYCLHGAGDWRCPECGRPFSCDELLVSREALGMDPALPEPAPDEPPPRQRGWIRRRAKLWLTISVAAGAVGALTIALWPEPTWPWDDEFEQLLQRLEAVETSVPDKLRVVVEVHERDEDGNPKAPYRVTLGYDGDRCFKQSPEGWEVSDGRNAYHLGPSLLQADDELALQAYWGVGAAWRLFVFRSLFNTFSAREFAKGWRENAAKAKRPNRVRIERVLENGRNLIRIVERVPDETRSSVVQYDDYLAPAFNWTLVRWDLTVLDAPTSRPAEETVHQVWRFRRSDYVEVRPGFWLPKRIDEEHIRGEERQETQRLVRTIDPIPSFVATDFDPELPPGLRVGGPPPGVLRLGGSIPPVGVGLIGVRASVTTPSSGGPWTLHEALDAVYRRELAEYSVLTGRWSPKLRRAVDGGILLVVAALVLWLIHIRMSRGRGRAAIE